MGVPCPQPELPASEPKPQTLVLLRRFVSKIPIDVKRFAFDDVRGKPFVGDDDRRLKAHGIPELVILRQRFPSILMAHGVRSVCGLRIVDCKRLHSKSTTISIWSVNLARIAFSFSSAFAAFRKRSTSDIASLIGRGDGGAKYT